MPKTETNQKPKRQFKWVEAEHPTIYSNQMGVGMTPFDIAIVFGEVTGAEAGLVTGVPRVKILLSPEQASNLAKLLAVSVEAFAKANGPIRTSGAVDQNEIAQQLQTQSSKLN
jgi:hypothetical protein